MVSHCYDWSHDKVQGGRSVTFIVKLIIPQKKIPLPCSRVLSVRLSCRENPLSLHAEMSQARQKLLGARLYAYGGKMHKPETTEKQLERKSISPPSTGAAHAWNILAIYPSTTRELLNQLKYCKKKKKKKSCLMAKGCMQEVWKDILVLIKNEWYQNT